MSVRVSVRALLAPVTCAAALLAAGPAAAATAPAASATSTPPAVTADRVQTTLRDVVDLQLLQPTCGERGALTAAAVNALHTIGVEAKLTGLPTLDLGPLGWIGFGTQHPGQAVAVELHLLPGSSAPVTLTLGAKPCPAAASATPTAHAGTTTAPATTAPAGKPAAATAAPAAAGPELAHTGGSAAPTWPYIAAAVGLLTAGAVTTGVARRRVGRG